MLGRDKGFCRSLCRECPLNILKWYNAALGGAGVTYEDQASTLFQGTQQSNVAVE